MQYDYMICPVKDLGTSAWSGLTCKPNLVFVWREFEIAKPAAAFLSMLVSVILTMICHHLIALCFLLAWANDHDHSMGAIPISRLGHGLLRVPRCTLRRILRLWVQARIQHQGLWAEYPRTRWHD